MGSERPLYTKGLCVDAAGPSLVYVATREGVYRSDNGGNSWRRASEGLREGGEWPIATDPSRAGAVYVATDDGLYRSLGRARPWSPVSARGLPEERIYDLAVAPSGRRVYASALRGGVYVLELDCGPRQPSGRHP
jgi:hypothetical protein